jgi:hypothetical protein
MQRIARAANQALAADPHGAGNNVSVLGTLRPAQIVNYRTVGSTPVILAVGLAAGAIVALGLTLAASVRRRRRDLALLKTLGFTQRQLAAAVAWQATVIAAIGLALGIPPGIVLGRQLWILFARNINAVPDPAVPVLSVLLVAIGALVFANLDAALPGLDAAHTGRPGATGRVTRSGTFQEPQIEGPEHQDNSDVYQQPRPELVPEEQDIHADHDGYHRDHVKHDGCRSSHRFVLLCAAERSKNSVCLRRLRTAASRSGRRSGRRGNLRVSRCTRGLRCR